VGVKKGKKISGCCKVKRREEALCSERERDRERERERLSLEIEQTDRQTVAFGIARV
jgi:hypothetical protein